MTIPDDLKERGRALWVAYGASKLDSPSKALVQETARCLDTLDRLDALLVGRRDDWVTITVGESGQINLVIDKLLAERRQYQITLKALLLEIRQHGIVVVEAEEAEAPVQGRGGLVDELKRKRDDREARESQPTG